MVNTYMVFHYTLVAEYTKTRIYCKYTEFFEEDLRFKMYKISNYGYIITCCWPRALITPTKFGCYGNDDAERPILKLAPPLIFSGSNNL